MLLRCYPKITDFIYYFFNQAPAADYRFLPVYSYGFFVACGFFAAATLAVIEMRRREKLGLLKGKPAEITVGQAPTPVESILYFLAFFFVFFKLFGLVAYQPELSTGVLNLKDFMLSLKGSWIAGIIGGAALTYYFYQDKRKQQLPHPEKKNITIYPSDGIGDIVVIAMVLGISGANLFNYFENPGDYAHFWDDPIGSMFSGLSVFGGLICAGAGFGVYAWRKGFSIPHFFDSVAPGFILANGIGRIGCHVSGDGDWGLPNPYNKPSWFPEFLWKDNYAHNIINMDPQNVIAGCTEEHCNYLTYAAYPTPLYELLMCTTIFIILWSLRKKMTYKPGIIFTIFLILIGIQRFAIEQWRDLSGRDTYNIMGIDFRQSELISILMLIIGVAGTVYLWKKNPFLKDTSAKA
ncbi:MAG TPA: prolipoprotein diacylglyceryl transferase family protein [Chitinophagales bacterium]|nr:prolipoprotein diacylglyceryl transferase family protein [Chitinophagales bacterium]